MNVYIWEYVEAATSGYHDGGGVLVVAESLEDARTQWRQEHGEDSVSLDGEPDHILPTDPNSAPFVLVFPDAGCC